MQINKVTETITDISEQTNLLSAIEEQYGATREISNNVSQAALGIQEVTKMLARR